MLNIISLKNVCVKVNNIAVIQNISLDIKDLCVYVLQAANGSGKSSLLNAIVKRKNFALEGNITMPSLVYEDAHSSDFLKLGGIFLMPQIIPEITGVRYIDIFAEALSNMGKIVYLKQVEQLCLQYMSKYDVSSKLLYVDIGYCSSGEKRMMLAIAAVILKPKLCLFDEIESGMDEKFKNALVSIIAQRDFASFVVTHDKAFIQAIKPNAIYTIEKEIWNETTL